MLDHHIQRAILYRLAFTGSLKFSQLKPDDLDNKLFTYHLQKVIKAGYAQKSDSGEYSLTADGRQLGTRAFDKQLTLLNTPESVLFLVIRRASDQAWLLYRRNTYPLRSQVGFMHCLPQAEGGVEKGAAAACQQITGLRGNFTALGGGYFRVYKAAGLESYTHFTLLYCDNVTGELDQHDEFADYFWTIKPDFNSAEFLPSTAILLARYQAKQPFFVEQSFQI